jgi:hypothetical protein
LLSPAVTNAGRNVCAAQINAKPLFHERSAVIWVKLSALQILTMTTRQEPAQIDDRFAQTLMAMREPPGYLGTIVRRLKQMPPMPPPMTARVAAAEFGDRAE